MNTQVLPMFLQKSAAAKETKAALLTERELTRQAAAGDLAAFKQIYHIHSRRVFSLCRRLTNSSAEAADVTQAVFVKLYGQLKSAGETNLNEQLRSLAINEILRRYFEQTQKNERCCVVENNLFGLNKNLQQVALTNFDHQALEAAVAQLPFDFRLIFVLHDFERLTHREISTLLGITIETSQTNLLRARTMLRVKLAETIG